MISASLKVDRLKITGIGLSKASYSIARQQLPGIADIQTDLNLNNAYLKYTESGYIQGVNLREKNNQAVARLAVGCTKSKHFYLACELYPALFKNQQNRAAFKAFNEAVTMLFPDEFGYEVAHTIGKTQYIEVAKDYMTLAPASFIAHAPYTKTSNNHKGTQYMGKQFTCYDKKKQLQEVKHQTSNWQNIVRIEAKARKTGIQPANLHTLANPFKALEVADRAALEAIQDQEFQDWLLDCTAPDGKGTTRALHLLPEAKRKKFRHYLRDCAAPWYDPEEIFSTWGTALQAIAPATLLQ